MPAPMGEPYRLRDYRRLPEGFPAQLLDGELVKDPSPGAWHQLVLLRVHRLLSDHVPPERLLVAPVSVVLGDQTVLRPDIVVLREGEGVRPGATDVGLPALVVEILSPETADRDRDEKTPLYLEAGIEEVWLVDPAFRTVECRSKEELYVVPLIGDILSNAVPGFYLGREVVFGR
jgi:Uma2 family endonuclease